MTVASSDSHDGVILFMRIILIIVNSILLVYAIKRLSQLVRKRDPYRLNSMSGVNSLLRPVETTFFSLIAIGSLPRLMFDIVLIIRSATNNKQNDASKIMQVFFEKMSPLIFITTASFITSSWYDIYSSFNGYKGLRIMLTRTRYEKSLIVYNIFNYASFSVLTGLLISHFDKNIQIAMTALDSFGMIIATVMLIVVGRRFSRRVLTRTDHTGQAIEPSTSFKIIFPLLLMCCAIRSFQQLVILYCEIEKFYVTDAILKLLGIDDDHYNAVFLISSVVLYLVGESGTAVFLVLMLNVSAKNTEIQMPDNSNIRGSSNFESSVLSEQELKSMQEVFNG